MQSKNNDLNVKVNELAAENLNLREVIAANEVATEKRVGDLMIEVEASKSAKSKSVAVMLSLLASDEVIASIRNKDINNIHKLQEIVKRLTASTNMTTSPRRSSTIDVTNTKIPTPKMKRASIVHKAS